MNPTLNSKAGDFGHGFILNENKIEEDSEHWNDGISFFLCGPHLYGPHFFFESLLNLLQYCSVLCFGFLARRHMGS